MSGCDAASAHSRDRSAGAAPPRRWLQHAGIAALALLVAFAAAAPGASPATATPWSTQARPAGCSAALATKAAPLIVFPSSAPTVRSGPGALLWTAPRRCEAGATAGEAVAATLGAGGRPGHAHALPAKAAPTAAVAAAGSAAGGVVVGRGVAASAYLGDVALATPVRTRTGWAIAVRVQRHYSKALSPAQLVPVGRSPVTALAMTLDYRAEILLAWANPGAIYARSLSQSGEAAQPARRLAQLRAGSPAPELVALLSDDGHAIVAWRTQSVARDGPGGRERPSTTLELSISGTGPGSESPPPRLLERFRDPGGFIPPDGSLRLLRLSSEAVMIAWTGVEEGRYVVRASPVSLRRGAWAPVAISGRGRSEMVLGDLAAGPDAEAIAVWRAARGGPDPRRWAIVAARGHYAGKGEVSFAAPEPVAPAGANGPPAVAIDPRTGRALAAWVSLGGAPHIEYAVRASTVGATPTVVASASVSTPPAGAIPATALACCLGLPYASIDSSAIRTGTPFDACLK